MSASDNLKEAIQRSNTRWENEAKNPSSLVHGSKVIDKPLTAEEKMFRDAILDIINDGWRCNHICDGMAHPWTFNAQDKGGAEEGYDNTLRLTFADRVIVRARAIKQFDGDEQIRQRR